MDRRTERWRDVGRRDFHIKYQDCHMLEPPQTGLTLTAEPFQPLLSSSKGWERGAFWGVSTRANSECQNPLPRLLHLPRSQSTGRGSGEELGPSRKPLVCSGCLRIRTCRVGGLVCPSPENGVGVLRPDPRTRAWVNPKPGVRELHEGLGHAGPE